MSEVHDDSGTDPEMNHRGLVPVTGRALTEIGSQVLEGYATESRPLPGAPSSTLNILVFLQALRGCWRLAFGLAVPSAFLVAVATWHLLPPAPYTSQALLHVALQRPRVLFATDGGEDFGSYQRTQVTMIKSRLVLNAVLQNPKVTDLRLIQRQRYAREWLQKKLEVDFSIGPEVLRIALAGDDPEEVAVIVNAVVDSYLQQFVHLDDNKRRERLALLKKYQKEWEEDLQGKRAGLKEQNGEVKNPGVAALKQHFALERLGAEEKELLQYQSELRRVEADLEFLKTKEKVPANVPVPASVIQDEMERDPVLAKHLAREAELMAALSEMKTVRELGDDHPSVRDHVNELEIVRRAKKARQEDLRPRIIQRVQEKARREDAAKNAQLEERASSLKALEAVLHRRVQRLAQEAESIHTLDVDPLQEGIDRADSLTKKAALEAEALKLEISAPPRVTLMEAAEAPRVGEGKGALSKSFLAGLATLGFVLFGFSWLEVRARKVSTTDDVISGVGMRIVGALPISSAGARGRLLQQKVLHGNYEDDLMTASIDATCTVLLHFAKQEMVRVLLVTSAIPGEGKTTLASHLAISFARAGRKTLLLDGDLRRPALANLFSLPPEPGLRELLRSEVEMDQVVRPSQFPRLDLMTTSPWDGSTLEALAQEHIPILLERLKKDYDLIVIDSAPVLGGVADSLLIAKHVDAVLFSIRRGVSRVPTVAAAQQRLAMLGVRMLGAVVHGTALEASYGYHYHYAGGPRNQ
jgi:succinoglycan biosynthesis transport protein ExoP